MNKLDMQFKKIKESKRIGIMTHVIVGFPNLEDTKRIVKLMAGHGADFVELQIPFSDPLADGPTNMRACEEALRNGTKVKDAFTLMESLSQEVEIPLLFMAYYNTVFKYGTEQFCRDAARVGAAGIIVPDIPIDEEDNEHFYALCEKYNLVPIHVVSPASTDERLKMNAEVAKGFLYATAKQGTTGATKELDPQLFSFIQRLRKYFTIPLAIGFGISQKEHIDALSGHADVATIGSKIVDTIAHSTKDTIEDNVAQVLSSLTR